MISLVLMLFAEALSAKVKHIELVILVFSPYGQVESFFFFNFIK